MKSDLLACGCTSLSQLNYESKMHIYTCILQLYIGNSEYYITKQFSSLLSGRALLLSALFVSVREPQIAVPVLDQ